MYTPITLITGYISLVISVYISYYEPQISQNNAQIMLILRKSLTPLQKNTKRYALNKIFPQMQVLRSDYFLFCRCLQITERSTSVHASNPFDLMEFAKSGKEKLIFWTFSWFEIKAEIDLGFVYKYVFKDERVEDFVTTELQPSYLKA